MICAAPAEPVAVSNNAADSANAEADLLINLVFIVGFLLFLSLSCCGLGERLVSFWLLMCFHRPLQRKKIGSVSGKVKNSCSETTDYTDGTDRRRILAEDFKQKTTKKTKVRLCPNKQNLRYLRFLLSKKII
jgi:hypothetical protein